MTTTTLTIVVANTTQFCRCRNSAVRTLTYKIKKKYTTTLNHQVGRCCETFKHGIFNLISLDHTRSRKQFIQ